MKDDCQRTMRLLVICTAFCISLASASVLAMERAGITITVLYDNYAHDDALQTDWGFSCLITGTEKNLSRSVRECT